MTQAASERPGARTPGATQRRLSFAKDKRELIEQLASQRPFRENRDVLVFAAAVGWHERRRVPLATKDEPIRWETATNRRGTEPLANMIAAVESNDPEILSDDRFDERLEIFEQYANGGLEVLRGLLASEPRAAVDVILELVQKISRSEETRESVNLADAVDELEW
jgi:dnd system-associated protein 4